MLILSRSLRRGGARGIADSAPPVAALSARGGGGSFREAPGERKREGGGARGRNSTRGAGEAVHLQERAGEMKRRGEAAPVEDRHASSGLDKVELAIELDAVADAQPVVEIEQVDAAAQQDVLAVVNDLGLAALFSGGRR